jgi:DNA-binding transcriptional MocR family regulator
MSPYVLFLGLSTDHDTAARPLPPGWDDRAVAAGLAAAGVVALPLSALTLAAERPPGLVLGYAGHDEAAMARAAERMANLLESKTGMVLMTEAELY